MKKKIAQLIFLGWKRSDGVDKIWIGPDRITDDRSDDGSDDGSDRGSDHGSDHGSNRKRKKESQIVYKIIILKKKIVKKTKIGY